MRIIKFGVNNFRAISGGLENNQINFDGSNTIFIFGQNNVGKSTFLAAYNFFFNDQSPSVDDFYKRDQSDYLEFEVQMGVDDLDLKYIQEKQKTKLESFKRFLNEQSEIKIKRTFTLKSDKGKVKTSEPIDRTWNPGTNKYDDNAFGSIGLIQVFQALMPTPILIKAMPSEQEVEAIVNEILSSKAKLRLNDKEMKELKDAQDTVKNLQEKMYNPISINQYQDEVNKHFKMLFPDTKIEIGDSDKVKWTEDKFGKKFNVEFRKQNEDGSHDDKTPSSYSTIGHGAVRSAIFSLLLMRDVAEELAIRSDRKEYLILFEEPELFLYPKILRSLRELIYSVSEKNYPYQVLCASHSPQMIDLSKRNSTLVRMVQDGTGTRLYQVKDDDLKEAKEAKTFEDLKQAMYEVLRFNPHICESFYADEVLLVEGPTEEIIIRGILQKVNSGKDLFIVNCGSVTNIPFYQKVYRKFSIKSHVICDTDSQPTDDTDVFGNPVFSSGIQQSIYQEHLQNCNTKPRLGGLLRTHHPTFEPAHQQTSVDVACRFPAYPANYGKPFNANKYWLEVLEPNFDQESIRTVPIIIYLMDMINFGWV
ncbi:MAG TPA: AAA family ATPase [Puia sp.]|uniref:ATP-dependent nuclease n=1 Tax=Puia sp. TaxID=2045100 RepID=UPI002C1D08A2|nr:AAA family ATPase [Puia sp.]HVU98500.1 AAA family ATPase [Puia sp.]